MSARTASLALALLAFAALATVIVLVFDGTDELERLRSRNDGEQVMNALFSSLRYHEDFGAAIEASAELARRVVGVGAYGSGRLLYCWGDVPETCAAPAAVQEAEGSPVRSYLESPSRDSLVLLLGSKGARPPPPSREEAEESRKKGGETRSFLRDTMRDVDVIRLEIRQARYWAARRLRAVLLPLVLAAAGAAVLFVRAVLLRNREYRRTIDQQRSLVILGTAASTLAHEIKNPLSAIRLQTGILSRTCPESARRELRIIDEEVERLSSLTHRVNDYLRDPAGHPIALRPAETLREAGERLAGRDLVGPACPAEACECLVDPDRLRSVLDNLLRNALESGGPAEGLAAEISAAEGALRLDVLDRGCGIPPGDLERVFDPFFTTKGRGTGIGLSVSRRFAEAAGGTIRLAARPGGGTRARLELPIATQARGAERGGAP